jgi:dTDP-4-amino-4,6-dideoxygalactose transaminase
LGCLGDGGAVLTSDDAAYEKLLQLRSFGQDADGKYVQWAMNSRLDNLQAAILDYRLKKYDKYILRRRAIASQYQRRLAHLRQLDLPPAPDSDPLHFDVFQNYEVVAEDRDGLKAFLQERGVGTLIQWRGEPVHRQRKLGFTQHLPRTDAFFERCLMLPLNTAISDADVDYVCDQIEGYYAGR